MRPCVRVCVPIFINGKINPIYVKKCLFENSISYLWFFICQYFMLLVPGKNIQGCKGCCRVAKFRVLCYKFAGIILS